MNSFYDVLVNTPIWVYGIFGYLIFSGVKSLKTQTVPLYRIAIMPIALTLLSLGSSVYSTFEMQVVAWFFAWSLGIVGGYAMMKKAKISVDSNKMVTIPGGPTSLVLSLIFFGIKYAYGVSYALYPVLKSDILVTTSHKMVAGAIAGMALGRFINIFRESK